MSPLARARENPVVYRTLVSEVTGRRAAFALGIFHLALTAVISLSLAEGITGGYWQRYFDAIGWGRCLHAFLQTGIFGLLVVFIPLRLCSLIDRLRREGCFDEVVASGVSPFRIAAGGFIMAAAYVVLLIATTLPYAAFCFLLGDIEIGEILLAYAAQTGFAMVLILIALAASILGGIRATLGVGITMIGFLVVVGGLDMTAAVAWITPLGFFIRPLLRWREVLSVMHGQPPQLFRPPSLFLAEVPEWILGPGLWILTAAIALCFLLAGPAHAFVPGLNSFGSLTFGRRTRRQGSRHWFSPLRRRVEIAFLYRNQPARWAGTTFRLRALALIGMFILVQVIGISVVYDTGLVGVLPARRFSLLILWVIVSPIALFDLAFVQSASLRGRIERIGPLRGTRGSWWDLLFFLGLGATLLLAFGPFLLDPGYPGGMVTDPGGFRQELLGALSRGFAAMSIFLVLLHLSARALSFVCVLPSRVIIPCAAAMVVALVLPAGILVPIRDVDIGRPWLDAIIQVFPIPAVTGMTRAAEGTPLFDAPFPLPHMVLIVILVALNIYLGSRAKRLPWAEAEHAI